MQHDFREDRMKGILLVEVNASMFDRVNAMIYGGAYD